MIDHCYFRSKKKQERVSRCSIWKSSHPEIQTQSCKESLKLSMPVSNRSKATWSMYLSTRIRRRQQSSRLCQREASYGANLCHSLISLIIPRLTRPFGYQRQSRGSTQEYQVTFRDAGSWYAFIVLAHSRFRWLVPAFGHPPPELLGFGSDSARPH